MTAPISITKLYIRLSTNPLKSQQQQRLPVNQTASNNVRTPDGTGLLLSINLFDVVQKKTRTVVMDVKSNYGGQNQAVNMFNSPAKLALLIW